MKQNADASTEFARGVEITDHHGLVDWTSAAAAGLTFAYIMATRGEAEQARHASGNWQEMKRAGVLRGACHYLQPLKDPGAQAHHFGSVAARHTDLPPSVRLKAVPTHTGLNEWDGMRKERRHEAILSCLAGIEKEFGRKPILFTNTWFLKGLTDLSGLQDYDLWLADYVSLNAPLVPAPWSDWKFWRSSEAGEIAGLSHRFCLDFFHGSASALRQFAGAEAMVAELPKAETSPNAEAEESSSTETEQIEDDRTGSRGAKPKPKPAKREEKTRAPEVEPQE
jgi:lysozyme